MAWSSVQLTLHGQNTSTYSTTAGQFREIVVDLLVAAPLWQPEETGDREPGIDGTLFQNVVRRMVIECRIRRWRIDAGEWDHADYDLLIECLSCPYLWIKTVTDTARVQTAAATDGTNLNRWTTGTGTILPLKVVASWDKAEVDTGNSRWLGMPLTLRAVQPKIGTTMPA
ncbi:MAG: hypothetical protein JNJ94_13290 [Chlorobi bacterium]|nr:hypothetical protein [Chlorobiota bacterium]